MSDDFQTCTDCGERHDRHAYHECPGSPDDRISALEERVDELEERLAAIERGGDDGK